MAAKFNTQGRILLTAAGIMAGGLIVYVGVSLTAPTGPSEKGSEQIPVPDQIQYGTWSATTWARAANRPSLVLLFVADVGSRLTDSVEAVLNGSEDLRAVISRRFVPIRIDRRMRPDLAERYAEGSAPFLSVLLPTGEALIKLAGDEGAWSKQLVEADRYWRDHIQELQDRAVSFWEDIDSDSSQVRTFRSPTLQDLDMVRESVGLFVDSLLALNSPHAHLWRPDIQRFLYTDGLGEGERSWAWQTLDRMHAHRSRYDASMVDLLTPAALNQSLADIPDTENQDPNHARLNEAVMKRRPMTTEELALVSRFTGGVQLDVQLGTWVDTTQEYPHSCRHALRVASDLDGYLLDAVAVLEWFLLNDQPPTPLQAEVLADSMWGQLWDPRHMALRDKPLRPAPVREVAVYPRAQLGRVAYLFDLLSLRTGHERHRQRADSCLAGFTPYVAEAGPAAAYYGWALLMRSQPDGRSGFPTTRPDDARSGT
jgi:hypothetical protein